MALGDRIKQTSKSYFGESATATLATVATFEVKNRVQKELPSLSVASAAEVAVARSEKIYIPPPASLPELPGQSTGVLETDGLYSEGPSCFACHHYDGKGATWPGTCRYFETIGEPAKEIDFNVVDPLLGCKCFNPESETKRLQVIKGQKERRLPPGDDPGWFTPGQDGPQRRRSKERPSSVSLAWLRDNIVPLRAGGWTASQLWRRNKSKGICWCELWDAPFLKAYLHDNGVIEFECVIEGRDIIQSARPMHRVNKRAVNSSVNTRLHSNSTAYAPSAEDIAVTV